MAAGRGTGSGGWFKSWDDELEDPKVSRMSDFEFRVWRAALDLCNRSPARLRRQGYLFHSVAFAVEARDFARLIHRDVKDVTEALGRLCRIGGTSSPLALEARNGVQAYRVRNWRKRQGGRARIGDTTVTRAGQRVAGADKTRRARRSYVDVDVDVNPAAEKASAAGSCPFCDWRRDHFGEAIPEGKRFRWQRYHDAYAERIGHCLVITAKERRLLKNACEKHGEEVVLSWWIDWLSAPSAIGHALAVFCSNAVLTRFSELEAKRQQDPQDYRP